MAWSTLAALFPLQPDGCSGSASKQTNPPSTEPYHHSGQIGLRTCEREDNLKGNNHITAYHKHNHHIWEITRDNLTANTVTQV